MVKAQSIRAWLADKGIDRCTACGSSELRVSKDLYALVCVNAKTGGPDYMRGSRVVRLRCSNCAPQTALQLRDLLADHRLGNGQDPACSREATVLDNGIGFSLSHPRGSAGHDNLRYDAMPVTCTNMN